MSQVAVDTRAPTVAPAGPPPPASTGPSSLSLAADAVLHAYSQVVFARDRRVGALLFLATMVVPSVGLVGLLGVALAGALALLLRMDRTAVTDGVLGYNALLVFLAIGAMADRSAAFWLLAVVTAGLVVLLHVALAGALATPFRLPVLSLPFTLTTWLVMAAAPHARGLAFHGHPPALDLGPWPGPAWMDGFLTALGAIFFQPHWLAGALVLAGLALWSRIAVVHAALGYAVAVAAGTWWYAFPETDAHLYVGFNFIVTAVALGGVFYVPGRSATALAAFGAVATGLVTVGLVTVLAPFGLPVLAAPFNLVVLTALFAMGQRTRDAQPRTVDHVAGSPEDNLLWWRTRVRRFHAELPVPLHLPVRGTWTCTQGVDGAHTHQGMWRHGLDFEVRDADDQPGGGPDLTQMYSYRLPVVAPAAGTVVHVVDGLPDNPVGHQDTRTPFGNVVVIHHAPGLYSVVGHLSPDTIAVKPGAWVVAGQRLALCGSSGRAPLPHVHLQVQSTPTVGDPTRDIALSGVVRETEDGAEVLDDHVPTEGDRLRNLAVDPALKAALQWPAGTRARVRLEVDGAGRSETILSRVDALGARTLHCPETGATLWYEDQGTSFWVYDYEGPGDDALFALYAALLRVPYDDTPGLRWTDQLEARRLRRGWFAWWADALAAVRPPPAHRIAYRLDHRGTERVVRGEAEGDLDLVTAARLTPGGQLDRVEVRHAGRTFVVTPEAAA